MKKLMLDAAYCPWDGAPSAFLVYTGYNTLRHSSVAEEMDPSHKHPTK